MAGMGQKQIMTAEIHRQTITPEKYLLSLRLIAGAGLRRHSPWHVCWNGQRVIANKGFEWCATESAQQAAEAFELGSRPEAYRLR
jgi:hypothetical protein